MSLNAHDRHQKWKWEQENIYGRRFESEDKDQAVTDLDLLKRHHQFLKDEDLYDSDEEVAAKEPPDSTSDEYGRKMADKYYDSLYKEYAMTDLKHYKTGMISLRWRTQEEVRAKSGEKSCANVRCLARDARLSAYELPFEYEEGGVRKSTEVKAILCKHCAKKLFYKKDKERETEHPPEARKRRLEDRDENERRADQRTHIKEPRR